MFLELLYTLTIDTRIQRHKNLTSEASICDTNLKICSFFRLYSVLDNVAIHARRHTYAEAG